MRKLRNHRDPGFTQVDNAAVDDRRLTVSDLGVLLVYLRHSDGWNLTLDSIHQHHPSQGRRGCGREAINASFRNLNLLGYIVKVIWRTPNGQWGTGIAVYDTPATADEVAAVLECEVPPEALDVRCSTPHLDPPEEQQVSELKTASSQVSTETRLAGVRGAEGRRAGFPNKTSRKTSSSSSSYSSADAPAQDPERLPLRGEDDDEDKSPPPAGRPAAERHTDTDKVIKKIDWPKGKKPRGHGLHQLREAVSCALTRGWDADGLAEAVRADVDWDRVRFPAIVVLSVILKHSQHASSGRTAEEEAILSVEQEIVAQRAAVASCGDCDERGRLAGRWHDHGRQGLDTELWELKNPDQAATNRALNGQNFRVA